MEFAKHLQILAPAVLAAAWLLPSSPADAQDAFHDAIASAARPEAEVSGIRVHIDNDLFAGRDLDRDYTGGLAITLSGTAARDHALSLDPLLAQIDRVSEREPAASIHHAQQLGLMVFTPNDIANREAQQDDRPYASLLFLSNGRMRIDADNRGAWSSSLTIGALGLELSQSLHDAVHELVGSESPRGYDHQISAGGEPTARYMLARHKLWLAHPSGNLDVKTTVQGSLGYLTEASAAISLRLGRFDSPWWSLAPELTDYIAAPTPVQSLGFRPALYFFAGARVKARAYNAFLQGQFRDSEVRYSFSQIEPVVAEVWVGVVTQVLERTELSYALHYQTSEVRTGRAARDSFWGGLQLTHAF